MVLDEPKPLHLLLGKVDGAGVAAEGSLLEIVADPLGKGDEGIRRARLKPDEGYQVGQLHHRPPLHLVWLFDSIAVPQPVHRDVPGFQLFIQRLELGNRHGTVLVPLVVDNAQRGDLVPVFLDKLSEGLNDPTGGLLLADVVPGI